ncbi:hypothetical protein O1611_g6250 [Lasiodiplodia mahajangana]|uniref:Uncharacterized protein n=1 Tax=Lasiodiplodia mahajangana TaxID=1108764 RepID=A0ACC2JIP3_9PEZI|nr:hypothetical protein O1611_g6250 [Lasiodiplodia mahajangana]
MNNEQFRRLIAANATKSSTPNSNGAASTPSRGVALGSRQKSSIPMTPRSVAGRHNSDFARQLAERNQPEQKEKKFRSFAPKGSKLAQGYVDRTQTRQSEEEDERAARLKALEEALKKEEIDQQTFDNLRTQIAGGDLSSTHLVKGLDFKLLERIRKGEDVYHDSPTQEKEEETPDDVEDELDRLQDEEVAAMTKEKTTKKGHLSTAPTNSSRKRTRDQILAEMKAARDATQTKESTLGNKFRRIGIQAPGTRIERDGQGREVMIIVDEDGTEKRKVHDDYDPLAGLGDDSDKEDEEENEYETSVEQAEATDTGKEAQDSMLPPPRPAGPTRPRNYFQDSKTSLVSSEALKAPSMSDPAIQAAFKKAASLHAIAKSSEEDDEEAKAKAERRRKMLENTDRDAEDMDMGFGTSRFEDDADLDEQRVKLSEWGREDDDGNHGRGGGTKRKRGPKKRKGDSNSAVDVLREMERQRAAR